MTKRTVRRNGKDISVTVTLPDAGTEVAAMETIEIAAPDDVMDDDLLVADADAVPGPRLPALPWVVAIGASAGGIEALRALAETLPAGAVAAYVVTQHTAPGYR